MDPDGMMAVTEALRRRAGMGASGAGISGGMQTANSRSITNPIAAAGMAPMGQMSGAGLPPAGTAENPSAGAISTMQKAQPGEAELIIKALSERLRKLA